VSGVIRIALAGGCLLADDAGVPASSWPAREERDVGSGDAAARTRHRISVEMKGSVYAATYEVLDGLVRLQTGQTARVSSGEEEYRARRLLVEAIESGLADERGLGWPLPSE
jgi:hypothetical protein